MRRLALLLLVLRVLADNHYAALAANDLALLTDRLYRRSYLHCFLPPSKFLVGWDTGFPATAGASVTKRLRPLLLLGTPSNTTAGQVVGRHLNGDLVAGENADKVHAELAGDVRQNLVTTRDLNLERGVWQRLYDGTFQLNYVVFCHKVILPSSVNLNRETIP